MASEDWEAKDCSRSTTSGGKAPGAGAHDQRADRPALTEHRHGQERPEARALQDVEQRERRAAVDVGDCTASPRSMHSPTTGSPRRIGCSRTAARCSSVMLWPASRSSSPLPRRVRRWRRRGIRHLAGVAEDGVQYRLHVERGVDSLAHLPERLELGDGTCSSRARLDLFEQPRVLDGDDGLVGEGLDQLDLLGVEGRDDFRLE